MSKFKTIFLLVTAGILSTIVCGVIFFGLYFMSIYNGLQTKSNMVANAWAKIESQYQRRYDLIPNLVETVKGAAAFEKGTLTEIAEARASVGRATVDIKNATPDQLVAFQSAHTGLSTALSKLMVVTENYPQLKTNENFIALSSEIAGTENRVAVARNDYNTSALAYNNFIVVFPNNYLAKYFGFTAKPYYQALQESATAPKVKF